MEQTFIAQPSWYAPILEFIQSLLTGQEWVALAWVLIVIFASTESFKRIVITYMAKKNRKQALYLCAFIAGLVASFLLWPEQKTIPWFIAGIVSGPLSNFLHYIVIAGIQWKFPKLAAIISGKKP